MHEQSRFRLRGIDTKRTTVIYSIRNIRIAIHTVFKEIFMILYDEVYFEITVGGAKADLKKFVKYLKGGALEEFFEVSSDFISYDDNFSDADDSDECEIVFANDDFGIEVSKFDTDDFLDVFCKETKALDVAGHIYDINDDEYTFSCPKGTVDYSNSRNGRKFNDELDELASDEDYDDNY